MAEEWMTGAMMVDMMAIEAFLGAAEAMNDPSGKSGLSLVFLPVETSAAAQAEVNASTSSGAAAIVMDRFDKSGSGGGVYPI